MTFSAGWTKIKKAAVDSFQETGTWLPLSAAAVFGMSRLDERTLEYATTHHPVFDNKQDALDTSDRMLQLSRTSLYLTTLLTPNADTLTETLSAKFKGITVQALGLVLTNNTTGILKREVGRDRPYPGGGNSDSFPSAHASSSAVYTQLSMHNVRSLNLENGGYQMAADIALTGISVTTAWARVEGGVHYPSDVLFGMALGNFFAKFVNRAFLDGFENVIVQYHYDPLRQSTVLSLSLAF